MRSWVFTATAVIAVGAVMVVTSRLTETCPASWEGAQRVEISGASANAHIRMDAFHLYAVSGTAMLDYGLHPATTSWSAAAHPLSLTMRVSALRATI